MNYCLIVVSMLSLGFVSVDRFVHIVYPLRYVDIMTVSRIRLLIAWTWIQGAIIGETIIVLVSHRHRTTRYFTQSVLALGY